MIQDSDTATAPNTWWAADNDDTITLNRTTTGLAAQGEYFEIIDAVAGHYYVRATRRHPAPRRRRSRPLSANAILPDWAGTNAARSFLWSTTMALPQNRSLTEASVSAYMADLSTAGSAFVVSPWRGTITRVYSVIYNAITGADALWTVEINNTAVTGISVTVANSGSAAGDVDSGEPTALSTARVNEGDRIEFVSDGASSTTCPTMFTAVIERD